ncbi:MAG: SDR family NAD(P)-dependent oxidoreductase [Armatimonadota bacterium]|jgi:NAD(P)-dependent dehydrogenase (short-subunit alcohol dehydrogenase family)
MSIEGKTIIITGGTSGIGEGCTRHFARAGAKVVTSSIQREEGEALQNGLRQAGSDVTFIYADMTDEAQIAALVERTVEMHGRIDGVCSNAGAWVEGTVEQFDDAQWDLVMGVNVRGNFLLAKHLVPVFREQGEGVLLITTSTAAYVGFPAHALYCASKSALVALIRCLTKDHAGYMRCVGICPGTIDTPMLAASAEGFDQPLDELYAEVAAKIPVRRLGRPEDVAKAAAFLLSDDAGFIAGSTVFLEGGTLALPPW